MLRQRQAIPKANSSLQGAKRRRWELGGHEGRGVEKALFVWTHLDGPGTEAE